MPWPDSQKPIKETSKKIPTVLLLFIVLLFGFWLGLLEGAKETTSPQAAKPVTELLLSGSRLPREFDVGLYRKVWDTISSKSIVRDVAQKDLFYGSVKGMVASLKDPYSVFFDQKETEEFQHELDGEFEGIGAEVGIKEDQLMVVAPLPGSPAASAGLRSGDLILAINDEPTYGLTLDQAVRKIRGEKGTKVVFTVRSRGARSDKNIEVTRAAIIVPTVTLETDNDLAIIRFYHFGPETASAFAGARDRLLLERPSGVILDLRNNPGGLLEAAVEVAGSWVENGAAIVREKGGDGGETVYPSRGGGELKSLPTAVLVNNGSASASEILAGALQDYGLAKIVGEKTFGKGTVQEYQKFEDGSSVKLTVAKWLTPLGRDISKDGIVPDKIVEYSDASFVKGDDLQLVAAKKIIKELLNRAQ